MAEPMRNDDTSFEQSMEGQAIMPVLDEMLERIRVPGQSSAPAADASPLAEFAKAFSALETALKEALPTLGSQNPVTQKYYQEISQEMQSVANAAKEIARTDIAARVMQIDGLGESDGPMFVQPDYERVMMQPQSLERDVPYSFEKMSVGSENSVKAGSVADYVTIDTQEEVPAQVSAAIEATAQAPEKIAAKAEIDPMPYGHTTCRLMIM